MDLFEANSRAKSAPLHPVPAADLLAIKFALDVRCDAEFCPTPEARSISRVKCLASWGDSMIRSVSSLVWAADGLQLKVP